MGIRSFFSEHKTAIKEFYRRNHVLFVHVPLALLLITFTNQYLNYLDPRIGVENYGNLSALVMLIPRVLLIMLLTFFVKRWFWFDIHQKTELELFEEARRGSYDAHRIILRDRAETVALLCVFSFLFTR